ncbi:Mitochondrial distribution and morphology protein 31 [Leucoagaricus sp. SymC.cos]|nr:Mitochondrial distribution and morphology protein 31 [Leucoagaricus sp. SymC.cos]
MALSPVQCRRALSALSRYTPPKRPPNNEALDRYSVIRNFFRSQTVALPMLPHRNHTRLTNAWPFSVSTNQTCEWRRWIYSYLREETGDVRSQALESLRSEFTHTHQLSRRLFSSSVGLNLQLSYGGTRWIHASAVCTNNLNKIRDTPELHDTRPQTRPSPSDLDEPPIPKLENSRPQPCTCANARNGTQQHPQSTNPPSESQTSHSQTSQPSHQPIDPSNPPKHLEDYSRFFRRLALSLPHPHRPTRDDFLNVATGFWQRLRIRFKWFTIKSFRKFNADDISAFVTWFLMSQTLWILIGTTTFFSVIFAIANSLRLQHYVARAISDYLTSETGVIIIFESAIVPKWRESRISFKNVYVSRRPPDTTAKSLQQRRENEYLMAVGYDVSNHPGYHHFSDDEDDLMVPIALAEEDSNMSLFDLTIDSVDVTLSLWRWLDGKGLVEDAVVRGVRGVLDRQNIYWDPDHPLDPALFRHKSVPGDFELESLQLEDLLITVYQPGGFRPYTTSIFRADIRQFRKQWLFYDFLCAENVVGQFDNCLFSLHKPQSIGRTTEKDLEDGEWARMSRIRIDGVNIDHLQNSTTMEGPISWITSGKVDAVLDIKFPHDPHGDLPFNVILGEIADAISTSIKDNMNEKDASPDIKRIPGQRELARPPLSVPEDEMYNYERGKGETGQEGEEGLKVVIDMDLRFCDLKAAVPIFTNDLSYVNNAFIWPIVAFMNANRTLVPIHCRMVKNLGDFDGAWTVSNCFAYLSPRISSDNRHPQMWESACSSLLSLQASAESFSFGTAGLMDEISMKTYDAMAYHVSQANMNRQRIKTVSLWSLQKTANAILSALRNIADPLSVHLKEVYLTGQQGMALGLYDTMSIPLGVDL